MVGRGQGNGHFANEQEMNFAQVCNEDVILRVVARHDMDGV